MADEGSLRGSGEVVAERIRDEIRQRKKNGKYVSDEIDVPPELDI